MKTDIRPSLYWDDFERRIDETVECIKEGIAPPVRRVAVFVTERCNFRCSYCSHNHSPKTMAKETFVDIVEKYGDGAIIHITGGEPSVVPWLYDYIRETGHKYRYHLNTNAYIAPPSASLQRVKVSLDSHDSVYWNRLVGRNAFDRVFKNIKKSASEAVTTITYTLTKENYKGAVEFSRLIRKEIPELYAIFFSVFKGSDERFAISDGVADDFFNNVYPELLDVLDRESRSLIQETIDEKIRLMQGVRFPQNVSEAPCYISMSERVFAPSGEEGTCSHLYRDGILSKCGEKSPKCVYGCNRRLVQFNEVVESRLNLISGMHSL